MTDPNQPSSSTESENQTQHGGRAHRVLGGMMLTTVLVFLGGVAVGVVYEKSLRAWKQKAERAMRAAGQELRH